MLFIESPMKNENSRSIKIVLGTSGPVGLRWKLVASTCYFSFVGSVVDKTLLRNQMRIGTSEPSERLCISNCNEVRKWQTWESAHVITSWSVTWSISSHKQELMNVSVNLGPRQLDVCLRNIRNTQIIENVYSLYSSVWGQTPWEFQHLCCMLLSVYFSCWRLQMFEEVDFSTV